MNVLLPSMPDSFEHTPTVSIRMPNGALTSLAGNVTLTIGSPSPISSWSRALFEQPSKTS